MDYYSVQKIAANNHKLRSRPEYAHPEPGYMNKQGQETRQLWRALLTNLLNLLTK